MSELMTKCFQTSSERKIKNVLRHRKTSWTLTLVIIIATVVVAGCGKESTEEAGQNVSDNQIENVTSVSAPSLEKTEEVTPDTSWEEIFYERNKQMNSYIENVTADELREVTDAVDVGYINSEAYYETDNKFFVISELKEQDAALYGLYGLERMVLRVKDSVVPIYEAVTGVQGILPTLHCGDYDNDGELEYAIKTHLKTGSGVSGDDLYIVEVKNDEHAIYSFAEEDRLNKLSKIQYDYNEDYKMVTVHNNGKDISLSVYRFLNDFTGEDGKSAEFDKLAFGDIESFFLMDGQWYYAADGGITTNYITWPQYECCMRMICPVYYSEESGFSFGEMQFSPYYYDRVEYTGFEKVLNVWKADITHGGKDEDVVLSITCADEESKELDAPTLLKQGECCYVRVYPSDENEYNPDMWSDTDGYCVTGALWESAALAEAHMGNGMVYLVEKDGKAYMMSASAGMSQGVCYAHYQVAQLAEYGVMPYVVDEAEIMVDLNSDKVGDIINAMNVEEMVSFTENWNEWSKNGTILVKTDISSGNIINLSGKEKFEAWEIWDDLERVIDMDVVLFDGAPEGVKLKNMASLEQALTSLKEKRLYWAECIQAAQSGTGAHDSSHHEDRHH